MFADIIIDITHEKLDKVFQYRIPPELEGVLQVGMEVIVPFGKGNKETHGYVIGFSEKADIRATDVKHISRPGYLGVQYHVAGLDELEQWHLKYAAEFQSDFRSKFGEEVIFFATVLEIMDL